MTTGFFWDEKCFWHSGGNYAGTVPVGGLVQPLASGGLPENPPETKRRLKNLMDVTGLSGDLDMLTAPPAAPPLETLALVHPATYLRDFKTASDKGGGGAGGAAHPPFRQGGGMRLRPCPLACPWLRWMPCCAAI